MSDFKAKMHQIRFPLRLHPDPVGGTHSAPRPLPVFKGATSKGREGKREGREGGRGNGEKGRGR